MKFQSVQNVRNARARYCMYGSFKAGATRRTGQVWHDIVCTVHLRLVQPDEPHRYCILRVRRTYLVCLTCLSESSALSKMGRLWALTFTPVIVMTFEFCQRGATVDTPFLTVLKTWTSPLEHLVITLVCVRLEFPEVSGMPCEASPHITGHGLRPPASDFMPSAMYIAGPKECSWSSWSWFGAEEAAGTSFVKKVFKVEADLRIGREGVLIANLLQSYPSSQAEATLVMTDMWPLAPNLDSLVQIKNRDTKSSPNCSMGLADVLQ
ncbi:hypothetical protein HYC85_028763 [Camellia sinensis]|uniref:Uncharacterized protein n=1 Tax=Camellia sinensis TaxID=4442 RepID=A0A7J7FW72_CAMSI|nr:hypothetical protein HYC85_028763 [Camellia sinensis]